jgi:redox-sensitive bicupin YhaK (pirin superfamily)
VLWHGQVGPGGHPIRTGLLAVLDAGNTFAIEANKVQDSGASNRDVLLLGGRPISEPMAYYCPFVMNTWPEPARAFEDFQKGRTGSIPVTHVVN